MWKFPGGLVENAKVLCGAGWREFQRDNFLGVWQQKALHTEKSVIYAVTKNIHERALLSLRWREFQPRNFPRVVRKSITAGCYEKAACGMQWSSSSVELSQDSDRKGRHS